MSSFISEQEVFSDPLTAKSVKPSGLAEIHLAKNRDKPQV